MPELLTIKTKAWELSVWGRDVQDDHAKYYRALDKRRLVGPRLPHHIRVSTGVELLEVYSCVGHGVNPTGNITLAAPIFFENSQYQFELFFLDEDILSAEVTHRLKAVSESFHFSPYKRTSVAKLSGAINTSNNIGWFSLPFKFCASDKSCSSFTISFEVLPKKIDLHSDLPIICREIDNFYPLWRFSIAEQTEQDSSRDRTRGDFPLMWLAQFKALISQFMAALSVVVGSPHARLQAQSVYKRAARLNGRLSEKLCERIREDLSAGDVLRYYRQDRKHLSVDTPENRFVKHVVISCQKYISMIYGAVSSAIKDVSYQRLSTHFLDELNNWRFLLSRTLQQSFWAEVGCFKGLTQDSLVLQQKTGYSTVYRSWQQLKYYLHFFSGLSSISVKPVSELYEVWCFLTLRSILIEQLGFDEKEVKGDRLYLNDFFEYQLKDGVRGAFEFSRSDGVLARLAHEPIFKSSGVDIRSFTVAQKPDIYLEIFFSDGRRCVWLFDAKYRIKSEKYQLDSIDVDDMDYVPNDAINQMHRYRDALIGMSNHEGGERNRPVFGAFALYPGYYDQCSDTNPYANAIEEVGVGAFPLLPAVNGGTPNKWLTDFLVSKIGLCAEGGNSRCSRDMFYLQNLIRMPASGMKQVFYSDLVLVAPEVGPDIDKDSNTMRSYLLSKEVFAGLNQHAMREIRFVALAVGKSSEAAYFEISWLFPVKKIVLPIESGMETSTKDSWDCLFELGDPLRLQKTIKGDRLMPVSEVFRFTTLSYLEGVTCFDEIPSVYDKKHAGLFGS